MAKKIRFPLILAEGAQVRSLEDLREHFDLDAVLWYYENSKLLVWLEDRYLEGEAKAIRALDEAAPDFQLRLCEVLGVEYMGADVDLEAIRTRQERLTRLRTVTDEDEFLQNIDNVAFHQEELADLLDAEQTTVYLCGKRFTVPASRKGVTYVGINKPEVKISGDLPDNFDELGITFRACKVDRPESPKLVPLKQEPQKEVPQGAKIVVESSIHPNMNVINGWQDIVSVTCSDYGVIGIKRDGTVVAEGWDSEQWAGILERWNRNQWNTMHSVTLGKDRIVGLRRNGTVAAESSKGPKPPKKCMVNDWAGITAVACGNDHTVGLCKNGTVVAVGKNRNNQCDIQDWKDIVSIKCTHNTTFGLKRDGTIIYTKSDYDRYSGTQNWTDIVSIECFHTRIAGLKKNGTVVIEGFDPDNLAKQVSGWQNIISIACGSFFIAGLRRDGTVVVATDGVESIGRKAQKWKSVVSIVAGSHILVGIVGPAG